MTPAPTVPSWVHGFLRDRRVAVLSLVRGDRLPLTTPVWYDWDERVFRVVVEVTSRKARLLARRPTTDASITVQSEWPPYRYVVMYGVARLTDESPAVLRRALARRYFGRLGGDMYLDEEAKRGATDATMRVVTITPTRVQSHDFHPEAGRLGRAYFGIYRRLAPLRP